MNEWEWGDPAYVAERRQENEHKEKSQVEMSSCHGCLDLTRLWGVQYCKSNHSLSGVNNLKRCKYFKGTSR